MRSLSFARARSSGLTSTSDAGFVIVDDATPLAGLRRRRIRFACWRNHALWLFHSDLSSEFLAMRWTAAMAAVVRSGGGAKSTAASQAVSLSGILGDA